MFQNREEAGQLLADKLIGYKNNQKAIILAIPRGGVVVGKQIADKLQIPLSVIVVKKLSAPGNRELAIGALAPSEIKYIDWELALRSGVEQEYLDKEIKEKSKEIEERIRKFQIPPRFNRGKSQIKNKNIIILTDDGVATGATTQAAIKYLKQTLSNYSSSDPDLIGGIEKLYGKSSRQARTILGEKSTIILAIPVIAADTFEKLKSEFDEIIALEIADNFGAVGQFYREFPQVTDEEVITILNNLRNL